MFGENPLTGSCLTCGFLAKHAKETGRRVPAPTFYEIETMARLDGECFTHVPDSFLGPIETEPECIKYAAILWKEVIDETDHAGNRESAAVEVFWRNRQCKSWYRYIPGLGPIEHVHRHDMERLDQERRNFELQLFRLEQTSQENTRLILSDSKQLARENKEIIEAMKASAEVSSGFNRRINLWLVVLAALTLLLAGLQVYFASRSPQHPTVTQEPSRPEVKPQG